MEGRTSTWKLSRHGRHGSVSSSGAVVLIAETDFLLWVTNEYGSDSKTSTFMIRMRKQDFSSLARKRVRCRLTNDNDSDAETEFLWIQDSTDISNFSAPRPVLT